MTREEAMLLLHDMKDTYDEIHENTNCEIGYEQMTALDMAIEALSQPIVAKHFDIQSGYIYCSPQIAENVKVVVRCKDCRHAHECHKSVQYTRNEPRTVTIGYTPIEFCSHGERREE